LKADFYMKNPDEILDLFKIKNENICNKQI